MDNSKTYDVVIAGGGMVGLSLAITLSVNDYCQPLSILLVDPSSYLKKPKQISELTYHPSFDARSTALSMSSMEHYRAIGVFDRLAPHVERIKQIHVSDKGHFGSASLDANEFSMSEFGAVVENHWLGAVLLRRVAECVNVELMGGYKVLDLSPRAETVEMTVQGQNGEMHKLSSRLLVVADGAGSALRDHIGIEVDRVDYQQSALIANLQTQLPHNNIAYERFTPNGAVALLPLPDLPQQKNRSALVWTLPNASAAEHREMSEADFLRALNDEFGNRLGAFVAVGERHAFPLVLEKALEECRRRVVILGNAAHTLHPIAGQGFNLSLRDVAALANRVLLAHKQTEDIGSLDVLEQYVDSQRRDKKKTIAFSHQLIRLYQQQLLPLQLGRNASLLLFDTLLLPKQEFVRQTAGIAGARYFS